MSLILRTPSTVVRPKAGNAGAIQPACKFNALNKASTSGPIFPSNSESIFLYVRFVPQGGIVLAITATALAACPDDILRIATETDSMSDVESSRRFSALPHGNTKMESVLPQNWAAASAAPVRSSAIIAELVFFSRCALDDRHYLKVEARHPSQIPRA